MDKRNLFLTVLGLTLILLSSCTSVPPAQQTTTPGPTNTPQAVRLLKPAGSIPASCTPTPVYLGQNEPVPGVPWIAAMPSSSGFTGYLFFARPTPADKPEYYEPMHTNGMMPDGASTKILWVIDNASTTGEITVTGKNLSLPRSTFQQTFGDGSNGIPSIVDVPTAGCWHFDLQSGSGQATAIFWVLP